jgi:hypothetical protein
MMRGMMAALVAAASVAAAGQQLPAGPASHPGPTAGRQRSGRGMPPAAGVQQFQFRRLVFTIPANWSVQRADRQPFRMEYATVTGRPAGPRLTFSNTVALVSDGRAPLGSAKTARTGQGVSYERFEMPNPMARGVVYVFPQAGVSISAQVRTEADARAADAVAQSARRALTPRGPGRS